MAPEFPYRAGGSVEPRRWPDINVCVGSERLRLKESLRDVTGVQAPAALCGKSNEHAHLLSHGRP